MPTIHAHDPEVEHLAPPLRAFVQACPPPGPLTLRATDAGSRARGLTIYIDREQDLHRSWETAILAHEYAHVVDPARRRGTCLIWWWYTAAPAVAIAAVLAAVATVAHDPGPAVLVTVAAALAALLVLCWRCGSAVSWRSEFAADAHAAQLVTAPEIDALCEKFAGIEARRRRAFPDWLTTHPRPARRIAALRRHSPQRDGDR